MNNLIDLFRDIYGIQFGRSDSTSANKQNIRTIYSRTLINIPNITNVTNNLDMLKQQNIIVR